MTARSSVIGQEGDFSVGLFHAALEQKILMTSFSLLKKLFFAAIVLLAVTFCSSRSYYVLPQIEKTASDVQGFDLILVDDVEKAGFGLFGVGYAIKAKYKYFTYRGKIYSSVGGGSVLIRPITNSPSIYVVRETVHSKDKYGVATQSLIQIFDKSSGKEIARRGLIAGTIEDRTGWTGDHALKFVHKVLNPLQAGFRPTLSGDYRQVASDIDVSTSPQSSPYPFQPVPKNCPETIKIRRQPSKSTLQAEGFEFLPAVPLQLVACDSGRILVTSSVYESDLYFDVLSEKGDHISQGRVRLPISTFESHKADLIDVNLRGPDIEATFLVNQRPDFKSKWTAHSQVRVSIKNMQ